MKRVLVVALGPQSAPLSEAFRTSGQFAERATLGFLEITLDVAAALETPIPPVFALAWIFVDRSVIDHPSVHALQQRLSPLAPVTIAVHLPADDLTWVPSVLRFEGGVILQTYSDTSFELVAKLIKGFAAQANPDVVGASDA